MGKTVKEKYEKIHDINQKKIELRCGEVQRKTEVDTHTHTQRERDERERETW